MNLQIVNETGWGNDTQIYITKKDGTKCRVQGVTAIRIWDVEPLHFIEAELSFERCGLDIVAIPTRETLGALQAAHNKAEMERHGLSRIN